MRLLSWNVNGVRAVAKKGFLDWFSSEKPDQEKNVSPLEPKSVPSRSRDDNAGSPGWELTETECRQIIELVV